MTGERHGRTRLPKACCRPGSHRHCGREKSKTKALVPRSHHEGTARRNSLVGLARAALGIRDATGVARAGLDIRHATGVARAGLDVRHTTGVASAAPDI